MNIPTVETERLILRAPTLEDFAAYATLGTDPDFMRFMTDGSFAQRRRVLVRLSAHGRLVAVMGFGTWAIVEKATGRYIGNTGFIERRRDRGTD